LAAAHRIYGVMQIYRNFIHPLSFFRYPPSPHTPLLFSPPCRPRSLAGAKDTARGGEAERRRAANGYFQVLQKKSRFFVNYECHQFLSRSHCDRHDGKLPMARHPLSLSPGVESALQTHGAAKESKEGRGNTRKGGPPARRPSFYYTPALHPPFLSVSRKNRKSATPKKYYECDFMAAACALTYIHDSKDDLSRKTGIGRISPECGY